jgi:hypothetical protein
MAERYLSVEEFENITRNIRKRIDAVYAKSAFIDASSGVSDAGKPIKLNSSGLIDLSMIPSTLTGKDADTVDGFHLDQDVRTTASPTFSKLTITNKLGVNITIPDVPIHAGGSIKSQASLYPAFILLNDYQDFRLEIGGSSKYFQVRDYTTGTYPFRIYSGANTETLKIGTGGNVYLKNYLHVYTPDGYSALKVYNDAGTSRFAINPQSDGSWRLYDAYGGVWNMGLVQRNGKVGINTSSPAYTLDVAGDIHTSSSLYVDSDISVGGNFLDSYISRGILCDSRDNYKYGLSFDDNLLAFAVERGYTVTASESPDVNSLSTIFNGHPGYAAHWHDANTTYPLTITISNFGSIHNSRYFWIAFAWGRKPDSGYKIEVYTSDDKLWHTVADTTSADAGYNVHYYWDTYITQIRITIKSGNATYGEVRIGEIGFSASYKAQYQYGYRLFKGGDTMYGQLTLAAGDPTSDNHAARKAYVDTKMKLVWKSSPFDIASSLIADETWRSIDITGHTSSNAIGVILAVQMRTYGGGDIYFLTRRNSTVDWEGGVRTSPDPSEGGYQYLIGQWMQKLASGQVLHYKAKGTIANCKIVAYWE